MDEIPSNFCLHLLDHSWDSLLSCFCLVFKMYLFISLSTWCSINASKVFINMSILSDTFIHTRLSLLASCQTDLYLHVSSVQGTSVINHHGVCCCFGLVFGFCLFVWFCCFFLFVCFFEIGPCYVAQAHLKRSVPLPQGPQCWDYRNVSLCLVGFCCCCYIVLVKVHKGLTFKKCLSQRRAPEGAIIHSRGLFWGNEALAKAGSKITYRRGNSRGFHCHPGGGGCWRTQQPASRTTTLCVSMCTCMWDTTHTPDPASSLPSR